MNKTVILLTVGATWALLAAPLAFARGTGGTHPSEGSHSSTQSHSGSAPHSTGSAPYSTTTEPHSTTTAPHSTGSAPHSTTTEPHSTTTAPHSTSGEHPAGTSTAEGYHSSGQPMPATAPGAPPSGYSHAGYASGAAAQPTVASGTAHAPLPTDAGYGVPATRSAAPAYAANQPKSTVSPATAAAGGAYAANQHQTNVSPATAAAAGGAYANNHQTSAVNPATAAATGAAVRNSYAAHPASVPPTGWPTTAPAAATWPSVQATMGWNTPVQPTPYNYGTNITYQGNQVYYGNQPTATAEQYYQQASTLAASVPPPGPQAADWMPLGVFALVQQEQSDPHYVLHLALHKSGAVGGNYADLVSGSDLPIQGAVDPKTQRVAWTVGANKNTVGETGLYNLTQDEAPALIHIGPDRTQQWLLVRLPPPH